MIAKRLDRATRITGQISIGHQYTHETHELYNYKGLVYCKRCGGYGATKLIRLATRCVPIDPNVRSHGSNNLENIRNGKLPRFVKYWPDDRVVHLKSLRTEQHD